MYEHVKVIWSSSDKLIIYQVMNTVHGVVIEWQLTGSEECQKSINYTVMVSGRDVDSDNVTTIITSGVTRVIIPGLIPDKWYTAHVAATVTCRNAIAAVKNFTVAAPATSTTLYCEFTLLSSFLKQCNA